MLAAASEIHKRNLVRPPLPDALRRKMVVRYQNDTRELMDMLGRDLSSWLR
jgi:hypothetical protein